MKEEAMYLGVDILSASTFMLSSSLPDIIVSLNSKGR